MSDFNSGTGLWSHRPPASTIVDLTPRSLGKTKLKLNHPLSVHTFGSLAGLFLPRLTEYPLLSLPPWSRAISYPDKASSLSVAVSSTVQPPETVTGMESFDLCLLSCMILPSSVFHACSESLYIYLHVWLSAVCTLTNWRFRGYFLLGSEHWCCEYSHARLMLTCVFVDGTDGMHIQEGYV